MSRFITGFIWGARVFSPHLLYEDRSVYTEITSLHPAVAVCCFSVQLDSAVFSKVVLRRNASQGLKFGGTGH